jgi:uncharacterized tellurite resistance protein B-like protein
MDRESHEAAALQQFRDEALRASILIVLADGEITEGEIDGLQQVSAGLLGRPVDREELGQLCSIAEQNRIGAKNYVMTVSKRWNREQCVTALQAMFLAATAEGEMGPHQLALLGELRDILELTDREYEQAIEDASDWETA